MFPRRERLSRAEIADLVKNGRSYSGRFFYARALPGKRLGAAFSVGKKVARLSVTRHLVKRRAAHALRGAARGSRPVRIFLVARPEAKTAAYADLAADLADILRRAGEKAV